MAGGTSGDVPLLSVRVRVDMKDTIHEDDGDKPLFVGIVKRKDLFPPIMSDQDEQKEWTTFTNAVLPTETMTGFTTSSSCSKRTPLDWKLSVKLLASAK